MPSELAALVDRWCEEARVPFGLRPPAAQLDRDFGACPGPCRAPASPRRLASWERRFGFRLPPDLKAWLLLSDGFYAAAGPLVHPLSAIGPMIPFARVPGMTVPPESWFELGNPNWETVCIDLAYRWPEAGGDCPLFTSGDDERHSPPRLIAPGFTPWFLRTLQGRGLEYWFDPTFVPLGDPWLEHRRQVPPPPLPERLKRLLPAALPLLDRRLDDRTIARSLAITRAEVEAIVRHCQHAPADCVALGAESRI